MQLDTEGLAARDAYLNLRRVHERLAGEFALLFKAEGLSHAWYNVLRILAGGPDEGTTCREVGERLVNRLPDVTRLLDRMAVAGLIERERSDLDRRVVRARLSELGRERLARLEGPVADLHRRQFAKLDPKGLLALDQGLRQLLS